MSLGPEYRKQGRLIRLWNALDLVGIGRTVLKTLVSIVSPWTWWRAARGTWSAVDLPRVARESRPGVLSLLSPAAWIRAIVAVLAWVGGKEVGKDIADLP